MQTLVEIGPSNASQGQHRRKDATEQMKNQTLARTRTLVLGFSSADALPTKLRVPVGRTWIMNLNYSALEKPRTLVRVLASVRFLVCCVLSSLLPWRSVGRSNFDRGLLNSTMLIRKTSDKNTKLLSKNIINCGWY